MLEAEPTIPSLPPLLLRESSRDERRWLSIYAFDMVPTALDLAVSVGSLPARLVELLRRGGNRYLDDISSQVDPRVQLNASLLLIPIYSTSRIPEGRRHPDPMYVSLHVSNR